MIPLVRAELLKLRSTRTALGLAIVTVLVSLTPTILLLAFASRSDLTGSEATSFFSEAAGLVPYVLLVFGILGMTSEYRHGTITYTYLGTPRRWQVMLIKLVVYALVGMLVMLAAVVIIYVVVLIGGAIRGVTIDMPGVSDLADYARQIVVAGLITAFGVALGALLRAQVITVAGILIWALIVEGIVAVVKPVVGQWLPFIVFDQVTGGRLGGSDTGIGLERPQAFLMSMLYIAVVSVAAVFISMRRDVT